MADPSGAYGAFVLPRLRRGVAARAGGTARPSRLRLSNRTPILHAESAA